VKPRLKGRPVVTARSADHSLGELRGEGGWREARAFADGCEALCPGWWCVPSDYETYAIYSKRMFNIMRRFTPAVENPP